MAACNRWSRVRYRKGFLPHFSLSDLTEDEGGGAAAISLHSLDQWDSEHTGLSAADTGPTQNLGLRAVPPGRGQG